jgi:hypothetical protein
MGRPRKHLRGRLIVVSSISCTLDPSELSMNDRIYLLQRKERNAHIRYYFG